MDGSVGVLVGEVGQHLMTLDGLATDDIARSFLLTIDLIGLLKTPSAKSARYLDELSLRIRLQFLVCLSMNFIASRPLALLKYGLFTVEQLALVRLGPQLLSHERLFGFMIVN